MENRYSNTSRGTNPTSNGVNILAIGTDRDVLNPASESARRQAAYGAHFSRFDIIVFARGSTWKPATLSATTRAVPTCSWSPLLYGLDALRLARSLPKPDVVTAQDPFETGLLSWLVARMTGARLHIQVHTDFLAPHFTGPVNRIRRIIARFVLARADRVRVVSNRIKESLVTNNYPLSTISVLPIFVDIAKYKGAHAGILAGRFSRFSVRFLVVSRLEREKNVALALDAFAAAAPQDACLIIVGDGSERGTLLKQAERLGIMARTFFEGLADPAPYYAASDLVLVPSRYEGYGRVIVEALAAGKPVLATDVGIARDAGAIVADEAHFVEALGEWSAHGPRTGDLRQYPYTSFEAYVDAYCKDLMAAAR